MSDIPTDLIIKTLVLLPVKSLLRFRCVSKSWRALIDCPRFVKRHLNYSLELKRTNVNTDCILCGYSSLSHVSVESHNSHSIAFNFPLKNDDNRTYTFGYCNGLMLISHGTCFLLWNPSTRKYSELPFANPEPLETDDLMCAGFGYDKNTEDYKVVYLQSSLDDLDDEESLAETLVYSFQSNSWRRAKDPPPLLFFLHKAGLFVFGAIYWVVGGLDSVMRVAAFDLGSEEYELVPMPLNMAAAPERIDLGIFDECLSLSCKYKGDRIDIWLTRDPKNRESWAKFLSLKLVGVLASLKENVTPISYSSRSHKFVIMEQDQKLLLLYDIELMKTVRITPTGRVPRSFITYPYLESLVELKVRSREKESKKKYKAEEKPKKPKKRDDFLSTGFKLKL